MNWRVGRGARGGFNQNFTSDPTQKNISQNKCGSSIPSNKSWGEVTALYDQNSFWMEAYYLTWPSLAGLSSEEQLGYVSGSSGQDTGIRIWGHVETAGGAGQGAIDPRRSQIRLEIYDDKACNSKSDGTVIPVIPIHIGPKQPGFVGIQGTVQGSTVRVSFVDDIGSIDLEGQFSGAYLTGTIKYSIPGHAATLGRFTVPTCSFFQCY